jgi:hypothetical protein
VVVDKSVEGRPALVKERSAVSESSWRNRGCSFSKLIRSISTLSKQRSNGNSSTISNRRELAVLAASAMSDVDDARCRSGWQQNTR